MSVRRWLEQLPRANTGATTRALYDALSELNRVQVPASTRLQMLDCLVPVWNNVRERLQRQHLAKGGLFAEQPRQVARLLESMSMSIVIGYALVAVQSESRTVRDRLESRAQVATAVAGALSAQRYTLFINALLYQAPRIGFWRSVHGLFQLADEQGVALEKVQIDDRSSTCRDLYVSALLFAAAGLNQLHQRDLTSLYRRIPEWAPAVEIVAGAPERCVLAVEPNADAGPIYRSKATRVSLRWRGLDVSELLRRLEDELELPTPPAERALMLHLSETWGLPQSRGAMRIEVEEPLLISVGLASTHHEVAGDVDFDALIRAKHGAAGGNQFLDEREAHGRKERDVWDSVYETQREPSPALAAAMELGLDEPLPDEDSGATPAPEVFRVIAIDASPRGYRLQWPRDAEAPLQGGEIIGLRRETGGRQWMIGVVRWVSMSTKGPRVGVELLSAGARPHLARASAASSGNWHRVLSLPEMKAIAQPPMLVMPVGVFAERDAIELSSPEGDSAVVLTRLVEARGGFSQFEFREVALPHKEALPVSASAQKFGGERLGGERLGGERLGSERLGSEVPGFEELWERL